MNRRQGNQDSDGRMGTAALPPHLLRLFAPRPPLPYAKPLDREPGKKDEPRLAPVAQYLSMCGDHDKDYVPTLSMVERKKQKLEERDKRTQEALRIGSEGWDPNKDEKVLGDPYKTLHISRLSYTCTEKDLRHEFSEYGPIENIKVVKDQEGNPRGYAFIEFEREKDMKAAYKDADGLKIMGRRIVVDVERGRTVVDWGVRVLALHVRTSRPQEGTTGTRGIDLEELAIVVTAAVMEAITEMGVAGVIGIVVVVDAMIPTMSVVGVVTAIVHMSVTVSDARAGVGQEAQGCQAE
ncbi:hypothetical protein BGZ98_004893 [Dissophora globulifera]|nr:hypothetical protein BGZ98_004893 [Dissophora globulifera]